MSYTQTGTRPSSNEQFCTNEHNGCYSVFRREIVSQSLHESFTLQLRQMWLIIACKYIWKKNFFFILRENIPHEKFSPSKLFSDKIRAQIKWSNCTGEILFLTEILGA